MGTTSNAITQLSAASAKKQTASIGKLLEQSSDDVIAAGYMLDDFFTANLHHALGYTTQKEFIEKELDCSFSHVSRLKSIASYAYALGYTMAQIQTIYRRTGHLSQLRFYLYNLTEKRSVPEAVKTLRQEGYHAEATGYVNYNVMLKPAESKALDRVLCELGMELTENNRRIGSRAAMIELVALGKKKLKL